MNNIKKNSLNIGISSMKCWLFFNGDSPPIRAFSDANCDVCIGDFKRIKNGEKIIIKERVEYSDKHIVKLRDGFDGYLDEMFYGKIVIKRGNSPFINQGHE
jgi:hypothetical protein